MSSGGDVALASDVRRFEPARFPAAIAAPFQAALVRAHRASAFAPSRLRDAVKTVVRIAGELDLSAVTFRGGLDVGAAEIDHLWVAVDGRVVDVVLPVRSPAFVDVLRRFVAGESDDDELERAAVALPLDLRVVGEFPENVRYFGVPVWSERRSA